MGVKVKTSAYSEDYVVLTNLQLLPFDPKPNGLPNLNLHTISLIMMYGEQYFITDC